MDTIDDLLRQGYSMDIYLDDNGIVHIFFNHPKRVKSFSSEGKTFKEAVANLTVKVLGF